MKNKETKWQCAGSTAPIVANEGLGWDYHPRNDPQSWWPIGHPGYIGGRSKRCVLQSCFFCLSVLFSSSTTFPGREVLDKETAKDTQKMSISSSPKVWNSHLPKSFIRKKWMGIPPWLPSGMIKPGSTDPFLWERSNVGVRLGSWSDQLASTSWEKWPIYVI